MRRCALVLVSLGAAASVTYHTPAPHTLASVRALTELHVGIFRAAGWVVVREAWDPDDVAWDPDEGQPAPTSRIKPLANREPEPPADEKQFELAAALAARVLRAPALADPANGNGVDFMYDHNAMTHLLDGTYVVVVIPTDLVCVALKGVRSTILPSLESHTDDSSEAYEFELEAGDVLLFDSSACRGVPFGLGADHLLYRFAACDPAVGAPRVLWCTPPEIALDIMRTRL